MSYEILPEFEQDSPAWHEARMRGLGASEVAAVLGLSKWQTPLSVYFTKMGVPNEIDENLAYFGHKLEPVIAEWIEHKHLAEVGTLTDGISARSCEWPWLTASPDKIAWGRGRIPVELKTSSAYSKQDWADGVPLYYAAQVQTQIAVLDAPYGWLAVLHGGNSPELFKVERDDEFITDYLIPKTREFWVKHVLAKIPPEPSTSAEATTLWPGDPDVSIEGSEALYELHGAYGLMQAELVETQTQLDAVKLQLQTAMQDATELTYQGRTLFTWKPRKGAARFDTTGFRKDHPDLVTAYTTPGSPTRTFLRKKQDNE